MRKAARANGNRMVVRILQIPGCTGNRWWVWCNLR